MRRTKWLWLLLGTLGLAFLVLALGLLLGPRSDKSRSTATSEAAAATARPTRSLLPSLPTSTRASAPPPPTAPSEVPPSTATATRPAKSLPVFGAEMLRIRPERGLALAQPAGVYWLRYNGLRWADVEPTRGTRRWEQAAELESRLQATFDAGLETILVVRRTPEWAQSVPGSYCSAPTQEALEDMAAFLAEAVSRYKDPPFGVKYWELGNEPDVDPALVGADSVFGCWGDEQDPFYGGESYARMLKVVYPAIKAADPEAQVLLGGLLLDRDPAVDEHPNPPAHFLEGVLRAGGGGFFDIVSFHSYVNYDGLLHNWETTQPTWELRGGSMAGKIDFLREVLTSYGYAKPLMLTEAGLLCRDCPSPPSTDFLEAQAAYVPRLYVRSLALGLQATIWYTLDGPGWWNSGLLDSNQEPRPAYRALQALTSLLDEAEYVEPITQFSGLEGYAFQRSDARGMLWVLWAPEAVEVPIDLPPGLQQAYDLWGAPLSPQGGGLEVGFAPIYLELAP